MSRTSLALSLSGLILCTAPGCTHFVEARAIAHFTEALESESLEGLKSSSSRSFERKALRLPQSLDDLKILNLHPDQEVSIENVEDVSETQKEVTVTVGDSKHRLLYKLTRDSESNKWLVDDVVVTQRDKGLKVAKSITEQMDLLLTVREFLNSCEEGNREDALDLTTPEFAKLLNQLPGAYLVQLLNRVVPDHASGTYRKPKAQLDGRDAIVRVPRSSGDVVLSMTMTGDRWKIADLAVESKSDTEHIASLHKRAAALHSALSFLDGYRSADKASLSSLCTDKMFNLGLKHADLTNVPLPNGQDMHEGYQLHMHRQQADFVIPGQTETVKLTLDRVEEEDPDKPARFVVRDVTIYDDTEEKRLSALFTAQAIMQIFAEALVRHETDMLRETSTHDFTTRIWDRLDQARLRRILVPEIEDAPPKVLSTIFHGAVIEITVMQGTRALTYVLRERSGQVQVDDVLMPVLGRPNSLKDTLELLIPIGQFADAVEMSATENVDLQPHIELLQRHCSQEFNRMVWKQVGRVPDFTFEAVKHLNTPLTSIRRSDEQAFVILGDDRWGAHVRLLKEYSHFVIDEVLLISGPEERHRTELKHTLKVQLANGTARRQSWSHAANVPSSVAPDPYPEVLPAGHESPQPAAPGTNQDWPEIPVAP